MNIAKTIKELRESIGMSRKEFSEHTGIPVRTLTDIAKYRNEDDPRFVIQNWMRNRNTIEFLGVWEELHNPDFKPLEFERFKKQAGANAFTMSPKKWIEATDAIKDNLIPPVQIAYTYANEADMLNVVLFVKL